MNRSALVAAVLLAAAPFPCLEAQTQVLGPSTGGAVMLQQSLRFLGHNKRVLMIGAHPDDEDTELLTILSRGDGVEVAYLALTRGEGGQNLIGDELGEGLGLLRTGELVAARGLDGGRQYFTRAFDFGFSKTLEDTWAHWPRDSILKDVVRIVRRFRPQVIVSVFSGTPRDGHGQHQAAGWSAREAYRLAGDASAFPELAREEGLEPWTALKLYQGARFDRSAAAITLDGGALDPAVGQSFHQIAMRARSLHRSQDMGSAQDIGPSKGRVVLIDSRVEAGPMDPLFTGLDTTLGGALAAAAAWAELSQQMQAARQSMGAGLTAVRARLLALWPPGANDERRPDVTLADQLRRLDAALAVTEQLLCDARANESSAVPGEVLTLTLSCWNPGPSAHQVTVRIRAGAAWSSPVPLDLPAGTLRADTLPLAIPDTASPTRAYFLWAPRHGDLYVWPAFARAHFGEPTSPPYLEAEFTVTNGSRHTVEVMQRTIDQATGEVRIPVTVVPRVGVALSPGAEVWPESGGGTTGRTFTVTLQHAGDVVTDGLVRLVLPGGWAPVEPQRFHLAADGDREVMRFTVRPPATLPAGSYEVHAVAEDADGRRFGVGLRTVTYPHIAPGVVVGEAVSTIHSARIALPSVRRLGYVRGAADGGPEVLEGLGLPVELLTPEVLERGDLSVYDVIVIGPRAYETEPAVIAFNPRLLEYARAGGHLVVQYQQYGYFRGHYAPYRLDVAAPHDRVTDETAPVTLLRPDHPMLRGPNPIRPSDWAGWVQERGLYFPRAWDDHWTPLLRMADPGEGPLDGSLLVAPVGRGGYVYTGLAFFRQLPAAVPGAVRLFLNLLSPVAHAPVP